MLAQVYYRLYIKYLYMYVKCFGYHSFRVKDATHVSKQFEFLFPRGFPIFAWQDLNDTY